MKMSETKTVVGFDVDGVILNYFEGLMTWAGGQGVRLGCRPEEVDTYSMHRAFPGLAEWEVMDMIGIFNTQPDFGRLRPYPGALEVIAGLLHDFPDIELVAITSAGRDEITRQLRIENLDSIPFEQVNVIPIGASKKSYFEMLPSGSLFIEDLPHHAAAADDAGLVSVLYRHPYNIDVEHPRAVTGWTELDALIREHLAAAPSMGA
jgi:FMN phosphatase YigB (HAD superfamily)